MWHCIEPMRSTESWGSSFLWENKKTYCSITDVHQRGKSFSVIVETYNVLCFQNSNKYLLPLVRKWMTMVFFFFFFFYKTYFPVNLSSFSSSCSLHTCVCPLWNRAEPWSGLKRSTSHEMFLKAVSSLPSHLCHKWKKITFEWFTFPHLRILWPSNANSAHLLYSLSTKLRKISLLTVLKDSITSKSSAWGNVSTHKRQKHKTV